MSQSVSFRYEHRIEANVVVQDLTDWSGDTERMDAVEQEWLDNASQPQVTATITEFGDDVQLGRETQNHLADEWSENAQAAGIEKIAFVSDGIEARAVSANLDVPQTIKTFGSLDEALDWARE